MMFYFIPSWYDDVDNFKKSVPPWYRVFDTISFDDTINQLKIFQNCEQDCRLLLLSYQPQLRYYLHKEGLLATSYWSFFDDIQNIGESVVTPLHFKDLNWPDGVKFIYSPFFVVVDYQGQRLANIEFAENGNLLLINWYDKNQLKRIYYFDDRGFLSSIRHFKDGHAIYQDYLNLAGIWQIREHFKAPNYYLEVNPNADHMFKQAFYVNWDSLILERVSLLRASLIHKDDVIVISSHERHNLLLTAIFQQNRKIFSFFEGRYSLDNMSNFSDIVRQADFFVADSYHLEKKLKKALKSLGYADFPCARMTPFDTRLRLGRSQTIKELMIYCLIDGLSDEEWDYLSKLLLDYMAEHQWVELMIVSYESSDRLAKLKADLEKRIYQSYHLERFMASKEAYGENLLDDNEELELVAIRFEHLNSEYQIIQALDTARLVLDWGLKPHLYTQIASLSAGVPQINRTQTDYVSHLENGWILEELVNLPDALKFYLEGLSNWNKSLIHSIRKMGEFTSSEIINNWKELLGKRDGC